MSGRWRLAERSQRKEERIPRMSREQSDGEDDVVGTEVDRETRETEVELYLHLETDMEPGRIPKAVPTPSGAGTLSVEPGNVRFTFGKPSVMQPGQGRQRPGDHDITGDQPVRNETV